MIVQNDGGHGGNPAPIQPPAPPAPPSPDGQTPPGDGGHRK